MSAFCFENLLLIRTTSIMIMLKFLGPCCLLPVEVVFAGVLTSPASDNIEIIGIRYVDLIICNVLSRPTLNVDF